jgi:hypothetical protein
LIEVDQSGEILRPPIAGSSAKSKRRQQSLADWPAQDQPQEMRAGRQDLCGVVPIALREVNRRLAGAPEYTSQCKVMPQSVIYITLGKDT